MARTSLIALAVVSLTSTRAGAITRDEVMARAQAWVDVGVPYCGGSKGGTDYICGGTCNRPSYDGHPDWDAYRSDCSGFVSYAWGLPPPGRVTGGFAPFNGEVTSEIDGNDLQPGDALNNNHHVALFAGWIDQGAGKALVMEELNCDKVAMAHEITLSQSGGSSVYSKWHGEGYTAIRYSEIVSAPSNHPPTGYLDGAGCESLSGWAQDPDAPDQAIAVHIYVNGPAGDPGATSFALAADQHRDDLCAAIGSCNHGYSSPIPRSLLDGNPHEIRAYGIDTAGGNNPELPAAKTITCSASLPQGVLRHVTSPESLAAWKFSTFWQMVTLADSALAADPQGPDLPAAPSLAQADDGSPEVWFIDGDRRRHVTSPSVAAAWQLDLGAVQKQPAAKLMAIPQGTPLRPSPFLVKGSGPAVYLVDDPQPPLPSQGGAGAGGAGAGGAGQGGQAGKTGASAGGGAQGPGGAGAGAAGGQEGASGSAPGKGGSSPGWSSGKGGSKGGGKASADEPSGEDPGSLSVSTAGETESGGCTVAGGGRANSARGAGALALLSLLSRRRRRASGAP